MTRTVQITLSAILLATAAFSFAAQDHAPAAPKSKYWLLTAPDKQERFKLLERYLRGFDQPMWEVGERYRVIYDALKSKNYDLAIYHWNKIKTTIKNGYLKRPARQANADAILLNDNWAEIKKAFESRGSAKAWEGFDLARNACITCHEAEKVGYMNNQPLFFQTEIPQ